MLLTLSGLLVSTLAWGEEPIPRKDALRNGFYVAPLYSQTFVDEERGRPTAPATRWRWVIAAASRAWNSSVPTPQWTIRTVAQRS